MIRADRAKPENPRTRLAKKTAPTQTMSCVGVLNSQMAEEQYSTLGGYLFMRLVEGAYLLC